MSDEPTTESRNPASVDLDRLSTTDFVALMNREDAGVAAAVEKAAPAIAAAIDQIANALDSGGRLVYVGAGTSGRLGVLDAAECPPTFSAEPGQVVGIIAGGPAALTEAIEGAEDSAQAGGRDLEAIDVGMRDVVVGITASGSTPYVLGALASARDKGATTVGLSCNADSPVAQAADIPITVVVGPEVLAGSTRLKAGTATKMVLNLLSTGAMVRVGKTYGNLMVDLKASNAKLAARAQRIVRAVTGLDDAAASELLEDCGGDLKAAIVSHVRGIDGPEAVARIEAVDGRLREALETD